MKIEDYSNEINNNDYYEGHYSIATTKLNIKSINLQEAFDWNQSISNQNFIMLIIRPECSFSQSYLQDFISTYNENIFSFDTIYILELSKVDNKEQKNMFIDMFKTTTVPTTIFIKDKKITQTEIGVMPQQDVVLSLDQHVKL